MSINTTLGSLSTNPALNGPDGGDLPSTLDDQLRYHGAFIAQLRDGAGFSVGAINAALGFAPVQQGTGTSQLTNAVKIGWGGTSQLRLQIDNTDFGVNWPINIVGNAATATNATSAGSATNSAQLGGAAAAEYVRRLSANALALAWDSANGRIVGYVDNTPQPMYTTWTQVAARPTDLSAFTNGPGYMVDADVIRRAGAVTNLGNSGGTTLTCNISGLGSVSWTVAVSDARLKQDVAPTTENSLADVCRIDFKQFRFRQDVPGVLPVDDGRLHKLGVIAQELEAINPAWLQDGSTWKAPNQQALLYSALHSIKQLEARLAALEGNA